ncbi:glycosyltransferase family 1 protein [Mucilaginibacter gilvus]|uniref:Glycosyltransferase family 1 protein n=2 Tax=Mucilaginibacter gilvus TaxID=2305909 RepID=A0A444MTL8_9SPHI|nr:glycosyltransferase family 1 protein [Mucilaginibacter gilvus]
MSQYAGFELAGIQRKVRVAFFAEILTEGLDGAIRTMYQLIDRIDRERFEFLFVYGDGPSNIRGFESIKVPTLNLPINAGYSMALPVFAQSRLKETLQHFAPDVVHIATPSLLGSFGLNYAVQNKLPVISIYHTHFLSYIDYYFKHAPFLISSMKQLLAANHKTFYNQCHKVYVPSESIEAELSGIGIAPQRMQLWKRGIDTNLFSPYKKNKNTLQKLTGNSNPCILFASRVVWEKNLETLFEVYEELQNSAEPLNFIIAGDGTALKASKTRMPKAIFTGKINHSQLAVLYASSDVFLFPSVSETYGNVVLEAMASGLPCVIADGGGSKDFINQGVNGFKCQPYNAKEYAGKIRLLLANQAMHAQFIEEGLQYSSNFSWEELAATYFDDVTELAGKNVLTAV